MPFVCARFGYQPKRRTSPDCLAGQVWGCPHPVWTFAQNTALALARLLLKPLSQSEGLAAEAARRGTTPAIPSDLPRLVTSIELVVRSLGCLPAKVSCP